MTFLTRTLKLRTLVAALAVPLLLTTVSAGQAAGAQRHKAVQLEHLDRGLVAAATSEGVFVSWRLLGDEVTGHSDTGMTGADFNVYRDGTRIATVTDSTNLLDREGTPGAAYQVAAVVDGEEDRRSAAVTPWSGGFRDLPLKRPAGGVTPDGVTYTYSANDMSVGDVDGDGRYEFFVKWDPSNSKDPSQTGYTGNVFIDAYTFDGTLLYRIDLGVNVRAGAHYTQYLVYDFDGDGRAELMFKTAPGTKIISFGPDGTVTSERFVTMPKEDVRAGFSHADDFRLSTEGYYEHVVDMFQRWHEHPEVVAGRWPATLEAAFGIEPRFTYPLSRADAEALADHLIDVYAPSRNANNRLRQFAGFVLDGPEYLTVFNGASGRELQTIRYPVQRTDDGLMWGDYALPRIEPGNRVDRFLAGVAYLDGRHPSAVFARGVYTRATLVAYTWNGTRLVRDWSVDSGWVPMTNPFNDTPHGRDGTDPEFATLTTQGGHSLSASDVDGDGKQEIVYGSATIDDDGDLLSSSFDVLPPGSGAPGTRVRLGHGDAMHVTDIDPNHPGLEVYMVHENAAFAPYGGALRDAASGEALFGTFTGRDTGRGMVGDIIPEQPGLEVWGSTGVGLWTADGDFLQAAIPGTNQSIRWAADMTTQLVNVAVAETGERPRIDDWRRGTVLNAEGTLTSNGTKGNPGLVADVFGDWREEMLMRTVDSSAIRIYLSTEVTDRKLYTLMHDPQYRAEVARQQTVYNQPSYPSFYLGSDIDWSRVPIPPLR